MKNIDDLLEKELEKIFDMFSKEKNFHQGDYCAALTRYCISLNYDCADNPITATGFIMMCWAHEMKLLNDQNQFEELAQKKKLLS